MSIPFVARPRPSLAAAAYVGAWVVGLGAFGTGPAADADVAQWFADHRLSTAAQALLVHGVAAGALAAVLVAVLRRVGDRTTFAAGAVGVGASLVQLVLDLWRSGWSTGSTTTTLVDAIDRVDGFKMLAFAVMIAAGTLALRRAGLAGRVLAATGAAAVAALVVSGVGYLGAASLEAAAFASLPLLLGWVAGAARRVA